MLPVRDEEVEFAIQAVHRAALLASQIQAELVQAQPLTKADASPVTVADYAAQALIAHLLAQSFPDDPVVAEEESDALTEAGNHKTLEQVARFVQGYAPGADPKAVAAWIDYNRVDSAPRFWTIDPIDGTKGFLRGEQYAVALALVEGGQVQVAVLGCPNLVDATRPEPGGPGSLIVAKRGQGAWVTALQAPGEYRPLYVSEASQPAGARILRSVEGGHTNASQVDRFAQALQAQPVLVDSQAKYGMLAAGAGEVVLRLLSPSKPDYKEKIWDQAAGSLILEEAGGKITDLQGKPLDFTRGRTLAGNRGILATNGHLHPAALSVLERIEA